MKMEKYSNIMEWLDRCKTIPGYDENMEGAKMMGERFKKHLEEGKKDETLIKNEAVSKNIL